VNFGNVIKYRGAVNSAVGQIFILNADLSTLVGRRIEGWSVYNGLNTHFVTPVLVEKMPDGTFTVRGIGTSVCSACDGGGPFGLKSGTDIIANSNYYVGHFDGSWDGFTASANGGAVEMNSTPDVPAAGQIAVAGSIWLYGSGSGSAPANLSVGATNSGLLQAQSTYSIHFVAGVVPAPTVGLLGGAGRGRGRGRGRVRAGARTLPKTQTTDGGSPSIKPLHFR
jgi:hypothetical protein